MAKKSKSRRGPKKELLEYFEQSFNLDRLNIVKRVQPAKDKSKLIGIAIAVAIYTIGFMLAQYGWKNNSVSYEMFIKFTWILMVPATAVGVVSWMLFYNRMENVVRQDIAGYIRQLEAEQGLIWRFIPLLSALDPNNATVKKALMSPTLHLIPALNLWDF